MSYLKILRKLVDHQQFVTLKTNVQHYLNETADVQALPLLALTCAHLGERVEAEAVLTQLENAAIGLDINARVDLAAVYILTGRLPQATAALEAILADKPEHSLALARLAFCRMQYGQLDEACNLYQRSTQLAPDRLPVWSALVRLHLEAGDHASAQQALVTAQSVLTEQAAVLPAPTVALLTSLLDGLQLEIWLATGDTALAEAWLEAQRSVLSEEDWVTAVSGYANMLASRDRHAAAEECLRDTLKYYPDSLALHSLFAELAQIQGQPTQAIHRLRHVIGLARRQEKPEAGYWVRLSNACLHHLPAQARKAAEKAVELVAAMSVRDDTPQAMISALRLQAKTALAQVESQELHFDLAEGLFTEVLAENPYFLPALQGLGQQQMQLGRIDEAIALFERIKAIDPAKGYASLINARQFPEDENSLIRMEKAARQPSLEGVVHSGLLLQLASAWEKRKDYAKAFALAREANEATKKFLRYDHRDHRQRCARIRHAFCPALYTHRTDCGYRGKEASLPVFVLGMPRSGTTLVEQIIASHSQIFGAGELSIIPSRIQGLNRWERHVGSGREYPDCIDDLTPCVTTGIARGILDELKALAAVDKPGAMHVVDKLPHNFENIGFIKFLFPSAKIISVRRDPRDIALSNYFTDYQAKYGGMGFAYDLEWIGHQLADHNLLMHHWHQLFPGEILEINYEDLVENTETMARKLLDYIGVEWEPQVLAFNKLDRPVKTASVWQVRQPIYKTSKAKWERYKDYLMPLIAGTNARISWDPIEMVTLPTAGMFTDGVALYREDKLDAAEYEFNKVLHHLPEHAAASFMLGLIYVRKGHLADGIALMEKGRQKCPWNPNWRKALIQAYEMSGETGKAALLRQAPMAEQKTEEAMAAFLPASMHRISEGYPA